MCVNIRTVICEILIIELPQNCFIILFQRSAAENVLTCSRVTWFWFPTVTEGIISAQTFGVEAFVLIV